MKEPVGSLLHPSTLEPLFGTFSGSIPIDNSREYKAGLLSKLRSVDSILVDILDETVFLELRIYKTVFRSGASLFLWNRKNGSVRETQIQGTGSNSFLKQGTFRDGYWSFTRNNHRFNFRLDDTIRQGYTHSAVWEKDLNFQLDALVQTGDKSKSLPFSSIEPSGKDWFFTTHSPDLAVQGQLAWNDLSVSMEEETLAYSVSKGYSGFAFPLESRIYARIGGKKRIHFYISQDGAVFLWRDGILESLGQIHIAAIGKKKILTNADSSFKIELEPAVEASFERPTTWGTGRFRKTIFTADGWIKTKNKKETVKDGIGIWEEIIPKSSD
ncbi:PF10974 family protein [Leptospira fainei serovar Hurstbridge str. BUT 6]|uniref:PF10974 family protein n=1 Tax=Leptospira fainei serovar Hurstbridge str. BUT 6 TaxID=1193011 RepID=S3US97_9LEPT|nr:DUF2804 family protein [Leptospira fainei]EPG73281.1 PF10974 family protein [Leptospira fainei serovar Hurstbridge str. BUT 6]